MQVDGLIDNSTIGRCCRVEFVSSFRCLACRSLFLFPHRARALAQSVQGAVNVTVTDPAGAVIPGATLELKAIATNDLRTGLSQESGTYRFVGSEYRPLFADGHQGRL